MHSTIRHVSDTALWVAMYRAIESERPDALFHDPYARLLAGERGATIMQTLPHGRSMAWPVIVRTAVIDEIVLRYVHQKTIAVINLGAGLDTRALRLPLPPSLHWRDVDLPDMIAYRHACLAQAKPVCLYQTHAADLTDTTVLASALTHNGEQDEAILVITEGVLTYLTPDQVSLLAQQIHAAPSVRWWLTDLASPLLLQMLQHNWQPQLCAANTPMQFAPANGSAFFTAFGWREVEYQSIWEESLRLHRSIPLPGLTKQTQENYRRMSSVVVLERII